MESLLELSKHSSFYSVFKYLFGPGNGRTMNKFCYSAKFNLF